MELSAGALLQRGRRFFVPAVLTSLWDWSLWGIPEG